MNTNEEPEWADEKYVTRKFGITHTPLYNLRKAGKIRSVSLRIEGRSYGKRLYHIGRIRKFLAAQEAAEWRTSKSVRIKNPNHQTITPP